MQQPTLTNVRVSSTRDALQIFYAVARRVLPMITRRLDAEERRAIVPGNVYVWEERCANAEVTGLGMERWTDGISWSASRIAQEFLFYRQRDTDPESSQSSAHWANIMRRRDPRSSGSPRSEVDRLIKQTFSVHVSLPDDRPRGVTRKWHLTAYFSQATLDGLNTIDMIPGVGDVSVPSGWFKNARASKGRAGERPREESPPSWPDSWTGVEVPTDPFRPQYPADAPEMSLQEENHQQMWGSPASGVPVLPPPPHGGHHHHHQHHHSHPHAHSHSHSHSHSHPPPTQEYYPEYARHHHSFDQRPPQYHAPPPLPPPNTAIPHHQTRLPTLADAGVDNYRDPSPFTSQSSSSTSSNSEIGSSPLPATPHAYGGAPLPPPHLQMSGSPPIGGVAGGGGGGGGGRAPERNLVPLAVLKTINPPLRDPMAEDCLRRLSNTPRLETRWSEMRTSVSSQ